MTFASILNRFKSKDVPFEPVIKFSWSNLSRCEETESEKATRAVDPVHVQEIFVEGVVEDRTPSRAFYERCILTGTGKHNLVKWRARALSLRQYFMRHDIKDDNQLVRLALKLMRSILRD